MGLRPDLRSQILSLISRGQNGRGGKKETTGETPDFWEWLDFEMYDTVWYLNRTKIKMDTTDNDRVPARWLGVLHRVGSDLCYWLITAGGKVIARTTVQHVTQEDYSDQVFKQRIDAFNKQLEERLDDRNSSFPAKFPAGTSTMRT